MQRGTFRSGQYVALSGNEEIQLGACYELHGSFHWAVMAALPDSWLESALVKLMQITRPEFDVIGAELDADGSFRVQVIAKHNSPVLLIAAGLAAAGILILAGMKVEQIWQVVTGSGSGGSGGGFGLLDSIGLLTLVVIGYLGYRAYKG